MLAAMMYHRVGVEGKHTNPLDLFRSHLMFLKEHYNIVLPGDPLPKRKLSICLTFDDAMFDFYQYVYPLLKELDLKALLGVPPRYILDTTDLSPEQRLSGPYTLAMQDGFFDQKAPFCTWEEINEMVSSGHVEVASHSYMHCNLTFSFVDLTRAVVEAKSILESKLPQAISSFIYPFGQVNQRLQEFVSEYHPYAFRIGSAFNWSWGTGKKPLTRIIGDHLKSPYAPLSPLKQIKYFYKSLL